MSIICLIKEPSFAVNFLKNPGVFKMCSCRFVQTLYFAQVDDSNLELKGKEFCSLTHGNDCWVFTEAKSWTAIKDKSLEQILENMYNQGWKAICPYVPGKERMCQYDLDKNMDLTILLNDPTIMYIDDHNYFKMDIHNQRKRALETLDAHLAEIKDLRERLKRKAEYIKKKGALLHKKSKQIKDTNEFLELVKLTEAKIGIEDYEGAPRSKLIIPLIE
jgi:nicotinamide riboside kinase